ncbi:protein of unknown function DUF1552 [Pirellula staleyi DSM 6068]|uniref:Secreted protein containing DUF1552 n=1 Tax=Pirellula staleyi (strain ATCC 27377 / DSM 6068 / ICPB 4128) TaxID=530564 RepID=D2R094_PIRSD|nr:DUF1552 domain-containing protein [Pirellula staleyi]ADB14762.1 protein of unknown function DUF1552 [Pirellula staleyi DSM 6068]
MPQSVPLSRRMFLRGASVALALPMLDAMQSRRTSAADGSKQRPPRMACFYVPNGVNIFQWGCKVDGGNHTFSSTLEPLAPLKDRVTVLRGMSHPASQGGHSGADTWLTAENLEGTPGFDYRNSISADQVVAEVVGLETRLASLELSSSSGSGSPGHSHTLAFSRNAVPLAAESNPRQVFERLFVEDSGKTRAARQQRFLEDKSILDEVLGQSQALTQKLGKNDREKLDEYLTSVREVERRVKAAERWMDVPKAEIDAMDLKLDARPEERGDRQTYLRTMYELVALALQTDTTRVVTFEIGREAAGGYFSELGLSANHHELSHHGGDEGMLGGLAKIDRFHIEQLAWFLTRLASIEEEGTSLLDQTMVMYGSGMNSGKGGEHSPKDLPLLFAGGKSLGIKQGQHLEFADGEQPLSNLLLTMIQKMGVESDRFKDSKGTLRGLV